MSLKKLMTNYASHNAWANKTLIEWLQSKPAEVFDKEVSSSFSSILKTVNHIWSVQEFWYSVVTETEMTNNRYHATELIVEEVFQGLLTQSELLAVYVEALSESDLQKVVALDTPWVKGALSRYEFLQHVLNHSTYHRGQIVTIGHHVDLHDAPMTDYNFYNMVAQAETNALEV